MDVEVPANSDIVIEGYVDPAEPLRREGPFGDHTGFYSLADDYPVFHVTCITHRKTPSTRPPSWAGRRWRTPIWARRRSDFSYPWCA